MFKLWRTLIKQLVFIDTYRKGEDMLKKYKVRIIKTWDFELDGQSKKDIEEQLMYIINKTKILELPDVKNRIRWKIKQVIERNLKKNEQDN